MSNHVLCSFLIGLLAIVLIFNIFWILTPYQINGCNNFLPSHKLSLHFVDFFFLLWCKSFALKQSHSSLLNFVVCVLWVIPKNSLPRQLSKQFSHISSSGFTVLSLMIVLIHFEGYFFYMVCSMVHFHYSMCGY